MVIAMKWISVKDSLPASTLQFYKVIVATKEGVGFAAYDRMSGFGNVTLNGNVQHSYLEVTHWMPLPDAPAE